jgi:serine/threonine protein kinase
MAVVDYNLAISKFKDVIGFDQSNTIVLVNYLSNKKITVKNTSDRFTNWASSLRLIKFVPLFESDPNFKNNNFVKLKNANSAEKEAELFSTIGKGSFGQIFKGSEHSEQVYKFIKAPEGSSEEYLENFFRGIFLEAWIQTILSSDPTYGKNIAKVIKLKRADIANGIFIIMENIPFTSEQVFKTIKSGDSNNLLTMKGMLPMFKQIAYALDHFRKSYNFFHRDFHLNNFMATEDGTIKIIDFGLSCIRLNINDGSEAIFSMPGGKGPMDSTLTQQMGSSDTGCASFDILMLITSMYELLMPRNMLDVELAIFFELLYLYVPTGFPEDFPLKMNIMSWSLAGLRSTLDHLSKKPYIDALILLDSKIANLRPNSPPRIKDTLERKRATLAKHMSEIEPNRLFWTTYPDTLNKYKTLFTNQGDPFRSFRTDIFKTICDDPVGFFRKNEIDVSNYLINSVIDAQKKINPIYIPALPNTIYLKLIDKNFKEPVVNSKDTKSMPVAKPIPHDNKLPLSLVLSSPSLVPNSGKPRAIGWVGWVSGLFNKVKAGIKKRVTGQGGRKSIKRKNLRKNRTLKYL